MAAEGHEDTTGRSGGGAAAPAAPATASRTARLEMLAAAALFSTGAAAVKATSLSGLEVAGWRSGVAAVALAILIPGARRLPSRRQALVACAYGATLVLYVLANKYTTAANTIFLQSTAPLYILLFAPLWLREPIRRRDLSFMLVLAGGMLLFLVGLEAPQRTAPEPFLGNLLAAASGLTWGLTVIGLRWLARSEHGTGPSAARGAAGAALWGNVVVLAACGPWLLPDEPGAVSDWLWVVYLGVFQIGLAYVCMTAAVRRLRAIESGLILLVEPALTTLWAWWLHDEVPGPWARAGAMVILLATAWHGLRTAGPARA